MFDSVSVFEARSKESRGKRKKRGEESGSHGYLGYICAAGQAASTFIEPIKRAVPWSYRVGDLLGIRKRRHVDGDGWGMRHGGPG